MLRQTDKYKIDSHKLIYHVGRINSWLQGQNVYPIYAEISPSGTCNHRCTYCALDFMGYQPRFLDTEVLKERLTEMGSLGLRSVMYAGEGEPFLHKQMADIIVHTKAKAGIDVGITTNGVLMREEIIEKILGHTTWIKTSINGATAETYAKVHRTAPEDFDRVVRNMSYAAKLKRDNGYACTLGMQLMLLPENRHEAVPLARLAKEIGLDYLVVKPYSQHPLSKTTTYKDIVYSDYLELAEPLKELSDKDFNVIFRIRTMEKWDQGTKTYKHCHALPFWTYIDAGGNVWGCSMFLGKEEFLYGNINESTFQEIWESEKRKESLHRVETELDTSRCRINCRMDEVNRYLWELKNPPEHVNFI